MSTIKVSNIQTPAGVDQYLCKAWVNFNGVGTVAIRAAGNVSSITDNGVGDYTVNFTNAMVDGNYAVVVGGQVDRATNDGTTVVGGVYRGSAANMTSSSVRLSIHNTGGTVPLGDAEVITAAIFR